jgi:hypothetical protein
MMTTQKYKFKSKTKPKPEPKPKTESKTQTEAKPKKLMAPFWESHDDTAPSLAPVQSVSIRNIVVDTTRHGLPLASLYFLNGSIPSYLLLMAFNLALGLAYILLTLRDPSDMTSVDPRSRWLISRLADLLFVTLVLAVFAAMTIMFVVFVSMFTLPLFAPAVIELSADVDWQAVVSRKAFWILVGGSALMAGIRAQLAFDANVSVGTVNGSPDAAPVIGNIAKDRSRSKGAYAAQLTLIATFGLLCYVMLLFGSTGYYVLPIIYSLLLVFYDTRPDLARRIFPKLWR